MRVYTCVYTTEPSEWSSVSCAKKKGMHMSIHMSIHMPVHTSMHAPAYACPYTRLRTADRTVRVGASRGARERLGAGAVASSAFFFYSKVLSLSSELPQLKGRRPSKTKMLPVGGPLLPL